MGQVPPSGSADRVMGAAAVAAAVVAGTRKRAPLGSSACGELGERL